MVALLDFATRLGHATSMMQMQVFIKRLGLESLGVEN